MSNTVLDHSPRLSTPSRAVVVESSLHDQVEKAMASFLRSIRETHLCKLWKKVVVVAHVSRPLAKDRFVHRLRHFSRARARCGKVVEGSAPASPPPAMRRRRAPAPSRPDAAMHAS